METTTEVVKSTSPTRLEDALLSVALDLGASLDDQDRYVRLLRSVAEVLDADAACFLRLDADGSLVPVAATGLSADVLGRRFVPEEHGRLRDILAADGPVRFFDNEESLDPLADYLLDASHELAVHSCMGCPLRIEDTTVGVLTVDRAHPAGFLRSQMGALAIFASLLAAAQRTAMLVSSLERQAQQQSSVRSLLQEEVSARVGAEFIGISEAANQVRREAEMLAQSDIRVLILGETGVGKEVIARSIHAQSGRSKRPILYVNCAALPEAIAESELYGHTKGAFTGANENRAGKFEAADGGTLFLDEVGELPLAIQAKLLRVLQTGELQRVGSDRTFSVDVRVLAATNRDLEREVAAGRFRADLYHRLAVYPLTVPPLRERRDDVLVLASYFLDTARARLGLPPLRLTPDARVALLGYDWPGNVRELEHLLQRAALRASTLTKNSACVVIAADHLALGDGARPTGVARAHPERTLERKRARARLPLAEAVARYKRELVKEALEEANGNLSKAARALHVDRGNLHRLAKRLQVTTDETLPS